MIILIVKICFLLALLVYGKSFMSNCIAAELLKKGKTVIYQTAPVLLESVIDFKMNRQKNLDSNFYQSILDCDLLIIDDLGTETTNSFVSSQLFLILNERNLRKKSTIISTNLALDDIKNIYSERIFSRLSSSYTMLRLTGDDIRIQKKLLNLGGTKDVTS